MRVAVQYGIIPLEDMTEHLLSTVVGRTWATDMLCVLGVLCVCVFVGCAFGFPFLRLVLAPVVRTWRRMTPFARIAIVPTVALVANFAASKQGGTNQLIGGTWAGRGFYTTLFTEEIQSAMDDLGGSINLPRAEIEFFIFSRFSKLEDWR